MAFIDVDTLADMRGVANSSLDQTANIYHQQSGEDEGGGSAGGYLSTPDLTNIPCSVRPARGQFQGNTSIGVQTQQTVLWLVRMPTYFPVDSTTLLDIRPTDHVQVGGVLYEVKGAAGSEQSANINTIVTAFEVKS